MNTNTCESEYDFKDLKLMLLWQVNYKMVVWVKFVFESSKWEYYIRVYEDMIWYDL